MIGRLYAYSLAIFVLISLAATVVLFFLDDQTVWQVKASGLAAGLGSSTVYTVLFTLLVNRDQKRLYRDQIAKEFEKHSSILRNEITRLAPKYLPAAQYPGTREIDLRFNSDLSNDLCLSKSYLFRGASAKYVAARVLICRVRLESVKVVIFDPLEDSALRRRAVDRQRNPKYAGLGYDQVLVALREEVIRSLIALFHIRKHCSVEIALARNDTSVTRLECFDSACYISLYHSDESNRFPETLKYESGATISEMFRLECLRQFEDAEKRLSYSAYDSESDLIAKLQSIGIHSVDEAYVATALQSFQIFVEDFARQLGYTVPLREASIESKKETA